jgi:hypothetical protein
MACDSTRRLWRLEALRYAVGIRRAGKSTAAANGSALCGVRFRWSLTCERGGRRTTTLFPPSVFPLWKPPFLIPPFFKESTKGGKPRGETARRFHGAAPGRGDPIPAPLEAPRTAALRVARHHSAALPPLRQNPQGFGALVRPPPAQPVQGFDTAAAFRGRRHGARSLRTKPAHRDAGCVDEREAPRNAPGFPLPAASSFRCRGGILSFKRSSFTFAPIAGTKKCEDIFRASPSLADIIGIASFVFQLRRFAQASRPPAKPSCGLRPSRSRDRRASRFCFPQPWRGGGFGKQSDSGYFGILRRFSG